MENPSLERAAPVTYLHPCVTPTIISTQPHPKTKPTAHIFRFSILTSQRSYWQ